jgi:MFS family permease
MVLLLEPIKRDLHLSDSQLGLLTGIAFALFYAALGVPIARWADRGNRVTIVSAAIGVWALTVSTAVLIGNFWQLFLMRVAAGVGQAGCLPPMYSLVGDYFPLRRERTRAMSILMLSQPLSSIGYLIGGWLNARFGWRLTFLAMGVPGLLGMALLKWTVLEPRRTAGAEALESKEPPVPLHQALSSMWRQPSYRHLTLGMAFLFVVGQGSGPWYAAFLARSHGMSSTELGCWFTAVVGVGLSAGTLLGSYVANRWFEHNEDGQMRLIAITIAGILPCSAALLLAANKYTALIALGAIQLIFGFFVGPTFALLQRLVHSRLRATALAAQMLLANLIGMGVGPQLVGVSSDLLRPALHNESLRYSLLGVSFLSLYAAYHFSRVGHTAMRDLTAVESGA